MEDKSNPVYKDDRYGKSRELLYAFDEKEGYKRNVTYHDEADRTVLQQAWDYFDERIEEARQKVLAGEASPLAYYMEKSLTDPMNLGMMAGISFWKVKRHLKPKVFRRLSDKTLQKYADALQLTIEELKTVQ